MKVLIKPANFLLYSIVLFSSLTSLFSLSLYLDMRIHSSIIVYLSFTLMLYLINKVDFNKIRITLGADILLLGLFSLGKFARISYELRDAFKIPIEIENFQFLLLLLILICNIIIIYNEIASLSTN